MKLIGIIKIVLFFLCIGMMIWGGVWINDYRKYDPDNSFVDVYKDVPMITHGSGKIYDPVILQQKRKALKEKEDKLKSRFQWGIGMVFVSFVGIVTIGYTSF